MQKSGSFCFSSEVYLITDLLQNSLQKFYFQNFLNVASRVENLSPSLTYVLSAYWCLKSTYNGLSCRSGRNVKTNISSLTSGTGSAELIHLAAGPASLSDVRSRKNPTVVWMRSKKTQGWQLKSWSVRLLPPTTKNHWAIVWMKENYSDQSYLRHCICCTHYSFVFIYLYKLHHVCYFSPLRTDLFMVLHKLLKHNTNTRQNNNNKKKTDPSIIYK